jgi:hypothetical protein
MGANDEANRKHESMSDVLGRTADRLHEWTRIFGPPRGSALDSAAFGAQGDKTVARLQPVLDD